MDQFELLTELKLLSYYMLRILFAYKKSTRFYLLKFILSNLQLSA